MTISSTTLEKLMVAGLAGEALLSVVRSIEKDIAPSIADIARLTKNEADRIRMAARRATVALQSRDDGEQKEIPHTPLEKTNNINNTAREAVVKPSVSRGTRLPEPFLPLPNVIELARNLGFSDNEIKFEIAKFTDHWRSASGANAVKRDWQAALRNWFRNALKFKKPNGTDQGGHKPNSISGGFDLIDAAVAQLRQRESGLRDGNGEADAESLPRLLQIAS